MKIQIEIPDYISVKDYHRIQNLEHLSDLEKTLEIVHVLTGIDRDKIREWDLKVLGQIANDLTECLQNEPEFHPVIEYNGQLYGFQSINNMKLGEYTDLERLIKSGNESLNEVCAILYRPIESHRFDRFDFKVKHKIKTLRNKLVNIFKFYKVEPYNSETRNGDVFDDFPVQFALGAINFFLLQGSSYLISTKYFSNKEEKKMKTILEKANQHLLASIGDGLQQFTNSLKAPSLTSAGTRVLSTVI